MPAGEPVVEGRAAIQQYFKAGFDQFTIKASLTSQEFAFIGADWGYDRGKYVWIVTPKAGRKSHHRRILLSDAGASGT